MNLFVSFISIFIFSLYAMNLNAQTLQDCPHFFEGLPLSDEQLEYFLNLNCPITLSEYTDRDLLSLDLESRSYTQNQLLNQLTQEVLPQLLRDIDRFNVSDSKCHLDRSLSLDCYNDTILETITQATSAITQQDQLDSCVPRATLERIARERFLNQSLSNINFFLELGLPIEESGANINDPILIEYIDSYPQYQQDQQSYEQLRQDILSQNPSIQRDFIQTVASRCDDFYQHLNQLSCHHVSSSFLAPPSQEERSELNPIERTTQESLYCFEMSCQNSSQENPLCTQRENLGEVSPHQTTIELQDYVNQNQNMESQTSTEAEHFKTLCQALQCSNLEDTSKLIDNKIQQCPQRQVNNLQEHMQEFLSQIDCDGQNPHDLCGHSDVKFLYDNFRTDDIPLPTEEIRLAYSERINNGEALSDQEKRDFLSEFGVGDQRLSLLGESGMAIILGEEIEPPQTITASEGAESFLAQTRQRAREDYQRERQDEIERYQQEHEEQNQRLRAQRGQGSLPQRNKINPASSPSSANHRPLTSSSQVAPITTPTDPWQDHNISRIERDQNDLRNQLDDLQADAQRIYEQEQRNREASARAARTNARADGRETPNNQLARPNSRPNTRDQNNHNIPHSDHSGLPNQQIGTVDAPSQERDIPSDHHPQEGIARGPANQQDQRGIATTGMGGTGGSSNQTTLPVTRSLSGEDIPFVERELSELLEINQLSEIQTLEVGDRFILRLTSQQRNYQIELEKMALNEREVYLINNIDQLPTPLKARLLQSPFFENNLHPSNTRMIRRELQRLSGGQKEFDHHLRVQRN